MSYINTARKSRLTVNGIDESSRMASWEVSDESVYRNGIMRTSGRLVLGTTALTQYDYQREAYKRGQIVQMEVLSTASGLYEIHPRGFLYVMSTSFSAEDQQVTIEIGCKLALWTISDNIEAMYDYSVIELNEGQRTIQNISQGLYSSNKIIYQDNTGNIVETGVFDLSTASTSPSAVPGDWATGSRTEALSATPLTADELPDIVELEYSFTSSDVFSPQEKVSTDTSSYDVGFNARTWVREGSGDELNSVTTIDDSFSGLPGAAVGDYIEVVNIEKVNSSQTEKITEYFNGPGGQLTVSIQESYQPGVEVNAAYFEDQYSSCRYQAALNGDADSTSCSSLQATSPMLASRTIRKLEYDDAGTVVSETRELWKPVLAAAQSFNWKSESGEYGQPVGFREVSLTDIYRDTIATTEYTQDEDGNNVETITTYRSGAVEYSAGIYASTGVIGTAETTVSEPVSYPNIQGTTSLSLPTRKVTGSGSGMTVNVGWPTNTGVISELTVTSSLTDCQWGIRPTGYTPGSWQPFAALDDPSEAFQTKNYSALMYWGALPDTGVRKSGTWAGGSGSGFNGYIMPSSLPSIYSNVSTSSNRVALATSWTITVSSTDFVGPSNEVISILDGGAGYAIGDIVTWTNNVTPAIQFGDNYSNLGQALATDYGQSLNSTTITAQVTGVNLVKPLITIASLGSGYNIGDQVRVRAADISADIGQSVAQDLLFTIVSGEDGITDLGEGMAALSLTDYSFGEGSPATDQYAATSGTTRWDFRYDQNTPYPTTVTSTGGANGSTGRFGSYDPDGEGIVSTPQIAPFFVRNKGLQIIDNGYIRSAGIDGNLIRTNTSASSTPEFCWESWIYVDEMSDKGMALCHWGTTTYPSTNGNWMTPNNFQLEDGWGLYMRGGQINIVNIEEDSSSSNRGFSSISSASADYPGNEWFHVALTADNYFQSGVYNRGRYRIYVNGSNTATLAREQTEPGISNVYCYTGAGGFNGSDIVTADSLESKVSVQPLSNADYLKVTLSQTRFITGSAVYSSNFTPISVDPTPPTGTGTAIAGVYEGLEAVPVNGIGKAATVNLEIITGGSANAGGTGWDPVLVSPALPYTADIGTAAASGGSGSGMILNLGVGYSGESYSGQSPVVIRSVEDGGNGYLNGDVLTVTASDIQALLGSYGGGSVDNDLRFSVTPSQGAAAVSAWLFPDVVGTQFAIGDTVKVTRTEAQAAGAGDPGQDISASVTATTPAKSMQNLTLDALDGTKRVVVNTSKTDSTLPDAPDSNATPALPTLEDRFSVTIRTDAYDSGFNGIADTVDESLQVPKEYSSESDITGFVEDYSRYLKGFVVGEGYGLRIGEALRQEIMDSWAPMVGLRYTDERIGETFAMRADAASWGVSADEAAVVYNGIWLGAVHYTAGSGTTIGGGDFTLDVTFADDGDQYDGGNFTSNSASSTGSETISGGDFVSGDGNGSESYLDVGKVLVSRTELSFESAQSYTFPTSSYTLPIYIDWEGTALTEKITSSNPAHSYGAGSYTLSVYRESGT